MEPWRLALVVDDPLAPRILAWWKAKRPQLADIPNLRGQIAKMAQANSLADVDATLERLQLAELLVDGDIATIAEHWLSYRIGQQLGIKPSQSKKSE